MAGKSLSELDLKDEQMPAINADDLPEFGSYAPPPQPGPYRFRLPQNLGNIWEVFEDKGRQFVRALFDRDNPLLIVRASTNPDALNTTFQTRLSNQRRQRGEFEASDLDYLLKALSPKGSTLPTSNRGFMEALQQHPGAEFDADISYSWVCNAQRDIYVQEKDAQGNPTGETVKQEGTKGCGAKYYQKDKTKKAEQQIEKHDGKYPYEIACRCGAIVRAFANLDNIRK